MNADHMDAIVRLAESKSNKGILNARVDKHGYVTIHLQNGLSLNALLGMKDKIAYHKNTRPTIKDYKIWIDTDLLHNAYYRGAFAHEIGHEINPDDWNMGHETFMIQFDTLKNDNQLLDKRLSLISRLFKLKMKRELDAWRLGEPVANLLGVGLTEYNQIKDIGLDGHYSSGIDIVGLLINGHCQDRI